MGCGEGYVHAAEAPPGAEHLDASPSLSAGERDPTHDQLLPTPTTRATTAAWRTVTLRPTASVVPALPVVSAAATYLLGLLVGALGITAAIIMRVLPIQFSLLGTTLDCGTGFHGGGRASGIG